jgi:hypothetical protein
MIYVRLDANLTASSKFAIPRSTRNAIKTEDLVDGFVLCVWFAVVPFAHF